MPVLEQHRNAPQHSDTNSVSFGNREFPMNFNFLGGQQQMGSQQPGVLQSGVGDAQLQQQAMLKHMQEMHRQQQMLQAMQRNTANQMSFPNQATGSRAPPFINGTPVHDASNYPWPSQAMAGSRNWLHRGDAPSVQGYSNGVAMPPGHGQSHPLMGLVPQQASQSFYGVPISNSRSTVGVLPNQLEKTGLHELSIQHSLSGDQAPGFMEQASLREETMRSRQGFEGKGSFEHSSNQGPGQTVSYETFNQMQQKARPALDGGLDVAGTSASPFRVELGKQVTSSQPSVELDPTEQRILFGGDDNIWEAFGETLNESNGSLNNTDGAFPSLNSGSWSALMQSAVAEASPSNSGQERECHGVGVQRSGSQNNQQLLMSPDGGSQPVRSVNLPSVASLSSRPFPDASVTSGYHRSGFEQAVTNQTREFWNNGSIQQSPREENKWSGHGQLKAMAEGGHVDEPGSSSGKFNSKNAAGSWSNQQGISSSANTLGGMHSIQSESGDRGKTSGGRGKFNGTSSGVNTNLSRGQGLSWLNFDPQSKHGMERQQINSKDDPNISNKHYQEFWRPVTSAVQSGVDVPGKHQQYSNKGMQSLLDSSMNSSEHDATDTPETGKNDKRENSSDSYSSNLSNRASTGGLRENVWVDAGSRYVTSGGKQNPSIQVGQDAHGPRNFQYHLMGDVRMDSEHHFGAKSNMQPQATTHHLAGMLRSKEGPSRNFIPSSRNSVEPDKGDKAYGISSSGIGPGYVSSTPVLFDKSSGGSINSVAQSQNMLELLQKVDQSKEQNALPHLSLNDWDRSSGISQTEASDGDAGFSPKQSSSSQGFGLQLAPPSQGLPPPNFRATSQSFAQSRCSPNSYAGSEKGDKGDAWLASSVSGQSLPVHETHPGEAQVRGFSTPGQVYADSPHGMQPNLPMSFPSGSVHLGSVLWNQQLAKAGVQASHGSNGGQPSHKKQMNDEDQSGNSAQGLYSASAGSVSHVGSAERREDAGSTEMYQKVSSSSMVPHPWSNLANAQQLATHSLHAGDWLKNRIHSNNILESSGSIPHRQGGQETLTKGDDINIQDTEGRREQSVSMRQIDTAGKIASELQGKESSAINPSVPNNAASEKDIEAFGRSLKPNTGLVDKYSLLHQMQAMKEMVPNSQPVKRFKGMNNGAIVEQMIGKSNPTAVSQDLSCRKGDPQNSSGGRAAPTPEHSQVSLQMSPALFNPHGSVVNRQPLPIHDTQRAQLVADSEQQIMAGKSVKDFGPGVAPEQDRSVIDTGHVPTFWQTVPFAQSEVTSSSHSLASGVASASIVSSRPKKRKSATAGLLPWHKEATLGSQLLHDTSLAEENWARAAHCLTEKIKDEVDMHEDVPPVIRSRRRLALTTKLMQHIFRPPPAVVLSLDATTNYESVTYSAARLALGEACSFLRQPESDSCVSRGDEDFKPEERELSTSTSDQRLRKQVEDFANRATMLENDLHRLDNRTSVLELRLECQDLERFSIINRFARFHGRGQVDGSKPTSSSGTSAITHRAYPQRYVIAYSTPKNLPERVQCLSL